MDLLAFFDVSVKLGDTTKSQLVHEVNTVRIRDKLFAEALYSHRKCGAEEADLMILVALPNNIFQNWLKFWGEELVGFVHNNCSDITKIGNFLRAKIENATWSCNDDVDRIVQAHDVIFQGRASCGHHALNSHMLAHFFDNSGCLQCQFTCRNQDQDCESERSDS